MHLGRFHVVIENLAKHFQKANLPQLLNKCATRLDEYAQTRAETSLEGFRENLQHLIKSSVPDQNLETPYAQQIIGELGIGELIGLAFANRLDQILRERGFDHAGISKDFKLLAKQATSKVQKIVAIDDGFSDLNVEYEAVGSDEAEVGLLLPRAAVGETLSALTAEFAKFSKLSRAINELTGAADYDPRIRTISSSWWQIFLDLDPAQILVWVIAVERIVLLFQSNLEIKALQQQLANKEMPAAITEAIEKVIDERVSESIATLASELRRDHAKNVEEGRLNEIETQLRQGLFHLAKRMNQGAQVEINLGLPIDPANSDPQQDLSTLTTDELDLRKAHFAERLSLHDRARVVSTKTLTFGENSQLLLKYFETQEDDSGPVSK
jgi:hypothetical protein